MYDRTETSLRMWNPWRFANIRYVSDLLDVSPTHWMIFQGYPIYTCMEIYVCYIKVFLFYEYYEDYESESTSDNHGEVMGEKHRR